MASHAFLKHRLPILVVLLLGLEATNLYKLSHAMAWSNEGIFAVVASAILGAFLVGSVIALSFPLEPPVRARLQAMVTMLFIVQTALVCIVSFIYSLTLMPAELIAQLFATPVEATRRIVALAEGAAISLATLAFWQVVGEIWKSEIEERRKRLSQLVAQDIDEALSTPSGGR